MRSHIENVNFDNAMSALHDHISKNTERIKEVFLSTDVSGCPFGKYINIIFQYDITATAIYHDEVGKDIMGAQVIYYLGNKNLPRIPKMYIDNTGFFAYQLTGNKGIWTTGHSEPLIYDKLRVIASNFVIMLNGR